MRRSWRVLGSPSPRPPRGSVNGRRGPTPIDGLRTDTAAPFKSLATPWLPSPEPETRQCGPARWPSSYGP
eukprot:3973478-Alexandrium_andersonii.AAC.1